MAGQWLEAPRMLYFAYGSNLCHAGMRTRCPAAVPIGPARLDHYRLVFRAWADVEPSSGASVAGGLWRITVACEAALDRYEGVSEGLYRRHCLAVTGDESLTALVYRMTVTTLAPPEPDDLATILRGCNDFALDPRPVLAAARAAELSIGDHRADRDGACSGSPLAGKETHGRVLPVRQGSDRGQH